MAAPKQEATSAEAQAPAEAPGLTWVVVYPAISLQAKATDGKPAGEPVVFKAGDRLPVEFEDQGPFLRSLGHVTAVVAPQ